MHDKKLEWKDISYFSDGEISVSNLDALTIQVSKTLSVSEFIELLLSVSSKAENTLNASQLMDDRANEFGLPQETVPVLDQEKQVYTKNVIYTFRQQKTLTKQEVEG